jgi:hypothetical protein
MAHADDSIRSRRPGRVARQPSLARLQELLRPAVISGLGNTLLAAQLGDAVLTTKALHHNPDLVFGRKMSARGTADVLQDPFCRRFGTGRRITPGTSKHGEREPIPKEYFADKVKLYHSANEIGPNGATPFPVFEKNMNLSRWGDVKLPAAG